MTGQNKYGSVGFELTRAGCQSHAECGGTEYCDSERFCFDCSACGASLDVFDQTVGGECPSKCNVATFTVGSTLPPNARGDENNQIGMVRDVVKPGTPHYNALAEFVDANGNNWLASTRAVELMVKLAGLVAVHPHFNGVLNAGLVVETAYEEAAYGIAANDVTFHHEGRALVFKLGGPGSVGTPSLADTSTLARMAFYVGFGWIEIVSDAKVYVSVPSAVCNGPVDLGFLLDASLSIEDPRPWLHDGVPGTFGKKVLPFVNSVTSSFDVGQGDEQTRVAVASFSTSSQSSIHFDFNSQQSGVTSAAAVVQIPYLFGQTHTSEALAMIRTGMYVPSAGMRPDSDGVPKVLIVVTDGKANEGHHPRAEAEKLHSAGVDVFAIGVGQADESEINAIASNPDEDHAYMVKSFSTIDKIVLQITNAACSAAAPVECGAAPLSAVTTEGEFTYFAVEGVAAAAATITIEATSGSVAAFGSTEVETPGPFAKNNGASLTAAAGSSGTFYITISAANKDTIYVGVQGKSSGVAAFKLSADCTATTAPSTTTATTTTSTSTTSTSTSTYTTTNAASCAARGFEQSKCDLGMYMINPLPIVACEGAVCQSFECCEVTTTTSTSTSTSTATTTTSTATTSTATTTTKVTTRPTNDDEVPGSDDENDDGTSNDDTDEMDDFGYAYEDDDFGGALCDVNSAEGVVLCTDAGGNEPVGFDWGWGNGDLEPVPENASIGFSVLTIPAPTLTTTGEPSETTFSIKKGSFKAYRRGNLGGTPGTAAQRDRRAITDTFPAAVNPSDLAFAINSTTGELTVSGPLDYETRSSYPFSIRLEVNSTNNYTAIVFVNVTIAPVDCPAGAWSETGTYPCALHSVCPDGHNETQAPTPTSDRACINLLSSEKDDKKAGLIVGLILLFLLLLILLLLFCCKRKREEEKEVAEKAAASDEFLPSTKGGISDVATPAAAPVYGLAAASTAPKGVTAPLAAVKVDQPYKMATGAPLYETAGAYGPGGTMAPASGALYDAAGGAGEQPYDPFGKSGKPVYGMAASGNVAAGSSPTYETAAGGNGGAPTYDTAAAAANAAVAAALGVEKPAYGLASGHQQPMYDTAGNQQPMYDTAGAYNAAAAGAGADGGPMYDAAGGGGQSLSKHPSFSEGAPMYDVAGGQVHSAGAGEYDAASSALLNAGGAQHPLPEALYDQAGASGGSVRRSTSYDHALNTAGLPSSEPMYAMASGDAGSDNDAKLNAAPIRGQPQYAVGSSGPATYDTASGGAAGATDTYDQGAAAAAEQQYDVASSTPASTAAGARNQAAATRAGPGPIATYDVAGTISESSATDGVSQPAGDALYDAATPASASLQAYDIASDGLRVKSVRRGNPLFNDSST